MLLHTCDLGSSDGMMALPSGFSPFVEFSDESQQWRWIGKRESTSQVVVETDIQVFFLLDDQWGSFAVGPTQDTEKDISALCQLWLDSKDLVVKVRLSFNVSSVCDALVLQH